MKLYTLFKTQDPENHTLFSVTYPYRQNKGVPPLPGSKYTVNDPDAGGVYIQS